MAVHRPVEAAAKGGADAGRSADAGGRTPAAKRRAGRAGRTAPSPRAAKAGDLPAEVDVAVIGGGPAGSALAALVAARGAKVVLFERQQFPRFHIGESLIPGVNLTLERLGVLDQLDGHRFPRKHGVQFISQSGPSRPFYFDEVDDPRLHSTWQVLRSDFDAMLLENAVRAGVDARLGTEVVGVERDGEAVVGVRVAPTAASPSAKSKSSSSSSSTSSSSSPASPPSPSSASAAPRGAAAGRGGSARRDQLVRARVVVDASGQQGVIAKALGRRENVAGLQNASVYAHFAGAVLDPGRDAGSTLIYRISRDGCWLWFIPLPDVASVGLVAPARRIAEFGSTPEEILECAIGRCDGLRARLARARRTTPVRAIRDYTYRARRDGGKGWLLAGDALGFIDPIYSTGLFLSMQSAELASAAIAAELAGRGDGFAGYARDYQTVFDRFLLLVRAFYSEDFHFGKFVRDADRRAGLIDLLIGKVATPAAVAVVEALEQRLGAA
jgi:flavin-dependent dehydrogenase